MSGSTGVTVPNSGSIGTYWVTDLHGVVWHRTVNDGDGSAPWQRFCGRAEHGVSAAYRN